MMDLMFYVIGYFIVGIIVAIGIGFNPKTELNEAISAVVSWPLILILTAIWIMEDLIDMARRNNDSD